MKGLMHRSAGVAAAVILATSIGPVAAQGLKTAKLSNKVTAIFGGGGNAATFEYEGGLLLIDDKTSKVGGPLLATLQNISSKPVRFVLNTHWHRDHAGNNEKLGELGAVILSHDNVRKRLSVDNFMPAFNAKVAAKKPIGLPILTFTTETTFHLAGEEISIFHMPNAHTDGDSAVMFKNANILHAADLFFNTLYPFIDTDSGGSIDGVIKAADRMLAMVNDQTKIIPGHGPLSDAKGLKRYRDMLSTIRGRVAKLIDEGKELKEVLAATPSKDYDAGWANKFNLGFTKPDVFVSRVYADLKKNKK